MPRKIKYIKENMHVSKSRLLYGAFKSLDSRQPVIIVGREKGTNDLYVASTDSGQIANSLMAKAMSFLKLGYEKKES